MEYQEMLLKLKRKCEVLSKGPDCTVSENMEYEVFPQEWKEGHIVRLTRKGNLQECENYRGITLLSVPGKVFNRVILERLKVALYDYYEKLREEQAGFRKGKLCTDQIHVVIHVLRMIVEQSLEWNSPLYVNFVDFEKAFDNVDRESLWKLLRHFGVPQKLTALISKIVTHNSKESFTQES
ncbi:reverse transcriptase SR3-left [Elysia marginata]|uniref:Reverse transcriptase SR3-left n=1 Tax=Elysia marginata TaxID=1093978 RepID=A0AAV4I9M4_9GAST|nr:reverse transcriptase SR3-left [Elysia marginata]